jgi:thiamine pyrophosphokinase
MPKDIIIVTGGRLGNKDFYEKRASLHGDRVLIACDGGARHLNALGLCPDVIVGDMDSLDFDLLGDYERRGAEIIRYPVNKDFTDTALALDYALGLKPSAIEIWGALGGRIDHALANIHLLMRVKESGVSAQLVDEFVEVRIADPDIRLIDAVGCLVSLIALSPVVEDITLSGFEYPLSRECLTAAQSRGISNIVVSSPAFIRVGKGDLLMVRYWQKDVFPEVS